jgi:hypothetical protein
VDRAVACLRREIESNEWGGWGWDIVPLCSAIDLPVAKNGYSRFIIDHYRN